MSYKLKIPKDKGVKIYCSKCKKNFTDSTSKTCGLESSKKFTSCSFQDKHKYKLVQHISGTKNGTRNRILETPDYDEVLIEKINFKKEEVRTVTTIDSVLSIDVFSREDPLALGIGEYMDFKHGTGKYDYVEHDLSKEYLDDIKNCFKQFSIAMKRKGIKVKEMKIGHMESPNIVKFFLKFLDGRSQRQKQKFKSYFSNWYKFISKRVDGGLDNPFEEIKIKGDTRPSNKTIITQEEFEKMLSVISYDNGWYVTGKKRKQSKNHYREFLSLGFKLMVFLGYRAEEVATLQWKDVQFGNKLVVIDNLKVERITGKRCPMKGMVTTSELVEILNSLPSRDGDDYILAPDYGGSRKTIISNLRRAFPHYFKIANGQVKTCGALRKTNITWAKIQFGDKAKYLTGHGDDNVIDKHYINQLEVAKSIQGTNVSFW